MTTPINSVPFRWPLLALALSVVTCGAACSKSNSGDGVRAAGDLSTRSTVTALGRLVPGRAITSVGAQPGSRVLKLDTAEGRHVKPGDALVYLDTYPLKLAERDAAKVALDEAHERLQAETAYAEAVIAQTQFSLRALELAAAHEANESTRIKSLNASRAAPEKRVEDQQFLAETRAAELEKGKSDLQAARAALARAKSLVGLATAEARLKVTEAQLELTILRAPFDGEILQVLTYPGERIGDAPVLKMGDTADMHVLAEVHEADIAAVRLGLPATVTSPAFAGSLHGAVEEIGALVDRNAVLDVDPRASQDARVVEVRVKLDDPQKVAHLSHLQVSMRIELDPARSPSKSPAR
jgi:HlyD family secretion protein